MRVRLVVWLLLSSLFLAACSAADTHTIRVRVVSDFAPGAEAANVVTRISRGAQSLNGVELDRVIHALRFGDSLARGMDVATFEDIRPGTHTLVAELIRPNGERLASRPFVVDVVADATFTISLTADCASVECPGAGSPVLSACLAGTCVDPRCSVQTPEFCPPALFCVLDADCASEASAVCAAQKCSEGVCVETPTEGACAETEYCARGEGCAPIDGPMSTDPDSRCDRVCRLDDAPCVYGYYRCDAERLNPVCTPFVSRPSGAPCGEGSVCDEAARCVADARDAGVDASADSATDAAMPIDAFDGRDAAADTSSALEASVEAGLEASVDADVDGSIDVSVDASMDAADAADLPLIEFDRETVTLTEYAASIGAHHTNHFAFRIDRAPSALTCFMPMFSDPGAGAYDVPVCLDESNWSGWHTIYAQAADDDEAEYDPASTMTLVVTGAPEYEALGSIEIDVVVIDDDGLQPVNRNFMSFAPLSTTALDFSTDGRYVVYLSGSIALGARGCAGAESYVLHDRVDASSTFLFAARGDECPSAGLSYVRFAGSDIAFESPANNLVVDEADENGFTDVFFYEVGVGAERISRALDDGDANGPSSLVAVSDDGRYVLFRSTATNLVATTDLNEGGDYFLRDRVAETTTLVSHTPGGAAGNSDSNTATMTADGTEILFQSNSSDIDGSGAGHFIYTVADGSIVRSPYVGWGPQYMVPDGSAFFVFDGELVEDVWEITFGRYDRTEATYTPMVASTSGGGLRGNGTSAFSGNADGTLLAFAYNGEDLYSPDTNLNAYEAYLASVENDVKLISRAYDETPASGHSILALVSRDGAWVLFPSDGVGMTPIASPLGRNIFVLKR